MFSKMSIDAEVGGMRGTSLGEKVQNGDHVSFLALGLAGWRLWREAKILSGGVAGSMRL